MLKRILKFTAILGGAILLLLLALIVFLSVTEYRPAARQQADRLVRLDDGAAAGQTLTVCSWNIGYAGLGQDSDFFMDGGQMVDPPAQASVEANIAGIQAYMQSAPADVWLLQEVDVNSARTGGMDQFLRLQDAAGGSAAFAYNYNCPFVPIPLPPIGRVESGLATVTTLTMKEAAERVALPCPFSWPVRTANIKRCLLVTRTPIEGSDRELVLVNLHLEAYESGEGRIAQTQQLLELLQTEYANGNYVIAGGDFNQSFPDTLTRYPIADPAQWMPGVLEDDILPEGWQFAYDSSTASCRLLDKPYDGSNQLYVIDGFILSPNLQVDTVETVPLDFAHADHNPVRLTLTLLP